MRLVPRLPRPFASSLAALAASSLVAALAGPLSGPAASAAEPPLLTVVTTTTILDDLVRAVGGERVRTQCLVQPGVDLHTFQPRPAEVRRLAGANLVVVNGLGLEGWIDRLVANSGYRGPIVVASAGVETIGCDHAHDHDHGHHHHDHGELDPHAWHDPAAVRRYVVNIRDGLTAADPAGADHYHARAAAYLAELAALETWARETLAAVPPERRKLVTSHDSLAYFARAFDFHVVPVAGVSTLSEPDARRLAQLVDRLRTQRVPAVFFETVSNPKLVRQLAADAGVELAAELYTDSLGAPGSGAETYLGMMRTNVLRIAEALR